MLLKNYTQINAEILIVIPCSNRIREIVIILVTAQSDEIILHNNGDLQGHPDVDLRCCRCCNRENAECTRRRRMPIFFERIAFDRGGRVFLNEKAA